MTPPRQPIRLRRTEASAKGFTLFEVLVALAIMALAAGLVLPSLTAGLNSAARHAARLSLEEKVLELRRRAINETQAYRLGPQPPTEQPGESREAQLLLPDGWTYTAEPTVVFYPDGTCSGGVIKLSSENRRSGQNHVIRPPSCRPAR